MKQTVVSEENGENHSAKPHPRPRRSNKPAMERRRRERINGCLEQLKNYVLIAEGKDPARYTKVEKADILEMTVRFLLGKKQRVSSNPNVSNYSSGYKACVEDIHKLLSSSDQVLTQDAKDKLLQHLRAAATSASPQEKNYEVFSKVKQESKDTTMSNCITIRRSNDAENGGCAKLVVRYVTSDSSPQPQRSVYSTWSPPVATTNTKGGGIVQVNHRLPVHLSTPVSGLCSPPSSPEYHSTRRMSLSPQLLEPLISDHKPRRSSPIRAPATYTPRASPVLTSSEIYSLNEYNRCQESCCNEAAKQNALLRQSQWSPVDIKISDTIAQISRQYENSKVCQQLEEFRPFQSPSTCDISPASSPGAHVSPDDEYRCCYDPPQSVPLDLAAPRNLKTIKREREEEECIKEQQRRQHLALPPPPAHHHLTLPDHHWRPWHN